MQKILESPFFQNTLIGCVSTAAYTQNMNMTVVGAFFGFSYSLITYIDVTSNWHDSVKKIGNLFASLNLTILFIRFGGILSYPPELAAFAIQIALDKALVSGCCFVVGASLIKVYKLYLSYQASIQNEKQINHVNTLLSARAANL